MKLRKLLTRVQRGDLANIRFDDFCRLVEAHGFRLQRQRGSHLVYAHERVPEALSIQPGGGQAKPYQVRAFLKAVEDYALVLEV